MQLWSFITYFAVVNLTNPLLLIRGSGAIQLLLYLGELEGGSVEAAKFMDKREAPGMTMRRYLETMDQSVRNVVIVGNLKLGGGGRVLQWMF